MESKVLNFPDGMKVASILYKHFDVPSLRGTTTDSAIVEMGAKLSVEDIVSLEGLLLVNSNEIDPTIILTNCTNSMIKNNILDLLINYEQIGMGK